MANTANTNGNDNVPLALIGSTTLLGTIGTATGVIDATSLVALIGAQLVAFGFLVAKKLSRS